MTVDAIDLTALSDDALALIARDRLAAAQTAVATEHFPVLMERVREVTVERDRRLADLRREVADLESIARATERSIEAVREATS